MIRSTRGPTARPTDSTPATLTSDNFIFFFVDFEGLVMVCPQLRHRPQPFPWRLHHECGHCKSLSLLFKASSSISFTAAFFWNFLPPDINFCISLPCFKHNLHNYISNGNFSLILDWLVWVTFLPKMSVVHMYMHEQNLNLMFLHICRNSV